MMIRSLRLDSFLSFAPGSEPFELRPLNVLIGPNGAGKSNVIEALDLLAATPNDLAAAVRKGGGIRNWVWKGKPEASEAVIEVVLPSADDPADREFRHRLSLGSSEGRLEVVNEEIAETGEPESHREVLHYRFDGDATLSVRMDDGKRAELYVVGEDLALDQSILAQRRDPRQYPEITWLGRAYPGIRTYSDWTFGHHSPVRAAQGTDLPTDFLLPDASNLALVLNEIEHVGDHSIKDLLKRFFPLFERLSIRIWGGSTDIYLFEAGATAPIPAIRLPDGTLRFLAVLAALHSPSPPSLLCIDEPELGLHPDAVALLADVLAEASTRMQLIVTTHSASLVSALTAHGDSIVTCERLGGGTVLNRVDPKQLGSWLADYTLGDLWQMGVLGGQSMNGIKIFMEGGGSGALGKAAIRQGMGGFLTSIRNAAQKKKITWNLIPCGSRENTFDRFSEALGQGRESVAHILLVDAEAVVTAPDPRTHLRDQDGWDLKGVPADAIHLMVQIMETWIVADPPTLASYYGPAFREASLPRRANLEEEPKARVLAALKKATKRTGKREYDKIKHGNRLLGLIDPERVQARCRHCRRLFEELARIVEAA